MLEYYCIEMFHFLLICRSDKLSRSVCLFKNLCAFMRFELYSIFYSVTLIV